MKLAVCVPSRGLVYSRTIEGIMRNVAGQNVTMIMTHGKPIPDCFNSLIRSALSAKADLIWLVEEDMALPDGILDELLTAYDNGSPVVTADYPVGDGTHHVVSPGQRWAGTGCLLVDAKVFEALKEPYFSTEISYDLDLNPMQNPRPDMYGQHDVDFYQQLKAKNIPWAVIATPVGQYRITKYGEADSNSGFHEIREMRFGK